MGNRDKHRNTLYRADVVTHVGEKADGFRYSPNHHEPDVMRSNAFPPYGKRNHAANDNNNKDTKLCTESQSNSISNIDTLY